MAKNKKPGKALKSSMKQNESIKANTKYNEEPTTVADSPAPRSSNEILKELMEND